MKEVVGDKLLKTEVQVGVYKKRWYILLIFIAYSGMNSFQWMEYCIINNVMVDYYKVSSLAVDWTSITYMVVYPFLVIPASYLIDTQGLRFAGLVGCLGTAIGTGIKVFSAWQDYFYIILIGQTINSAAQVFILCLPSKLAAVWFHPQEISRVCSFAILGTQIGFALGYIIPPLLVGNIDPSEITWALKILNWGQAIIMLPLAAAVLFDFPKQPKLAPSIPQALEREKPQRTIKEFMEEIKKLVTNQGYFLHLIGFGINVGVLCALGTFINQFLLFYFPNSEQDAGRMGLIMTLIGILGSLLIGYLLDKTRKYKEFTLAVYIFSAITVFGFMFSLISGSIFLVYLTITGAGFFLNAYIPVGYEFAVELTFPSDESTTAGLMNATCQGLGVIFSIAVGHLNQTIGPFWSSGCLGGLLVLGSILTLIIPNNLRRQKAFFKHGSISNLNP